MLYVMLCYILFSYSLQGMISSIVTTGLKMQPQSQDNCCNCGVRSSIDLGPCLEWLVRV